MSHYLGITRGWDWAEHIANGYLGGTDIVWPRTVAVVAPVAGTVTKTAHSVTITEPDGWRTVVLELASTNLAKKTVKAGDPIGYRGKWPHFHSLTPAGVRVRARFINADDAPLPNPQPPTETDEDMQYEITRVKLDDPGAPDHGAEAVYGNGVGNKIKWRQLSRFANDPDSLVKMFGDRRVVMNARAAIPIYRIVSGKDGNAIPVDRASWDQFKKEWS